MANGSGGLTINTVFVVSMGACAAIGTVGGVAAGTVAGAGQDLQDAGEAVERTANKVKKKL